MLEIHIPDNFEIEREYILDVVFNDFLGLQYRTVLRKDQRDYKIVLGNGSILVIEDHFFGTLGDKGDYLSEENIPDRVKFAFNDFTPERDVPVIYGNSDLRESGSQSAMTLVCCIDIFASSFFMLTRWEECVNGIRDQHNRFPGKASTAFRNDFLHRPVVNEYVEMLWNMLKYLGIRQNRKEKQFEWVLTHDVDMPFYWKNCRQVGYLVFTDLIKRKSPSQALKKLMSFFSSKTAIGRDPFDTFDQLMEYSESLGVKSCFFFMGGGNTQWDSTYDLQSRFFRRLIGKIQMRKHIIGFHPSYLTYNRPDLWLQEFETLSRASSEPITTGRQHTLRFEVPITWQIWEDNQMKEDQSVCYADVEGFRCGVCWSYPVFNILTRKPLRLRERPLTVMDSTLVNYQKASPDEVETRIVVLKERIKKYKGEFVFLWHNSSFYGEPWEDYRRVYPNVLGGIRSSYKNPSLTENA